MGVFPICSGFPVPLKLSFFCASFVHSNESYPCSLSHILKTKGRQVIQGANYTRMLHYTPLRVSCSRTMNAKCGLPPYENCSLTSLLYLLQKSCKLNAKYIDMGGCSTRRCVRIALFQFSSAPSTSKKLVFMLHKQRVGCTSCSSTKKHL